MAPDKRPRNCTTRRAGPGLLQAASATPVTAIRRRCSENGMVLVAGSIVGTARATVELYDPASGTWTAKSQPQHRAL